MLDAPFDVSAQCCNILKKNPSHQIQKETGMVPITATMASESYRRRTTWVKQGCNAFDAKNPISAPMSFWLERDVLHYIKTHGLVIAPTYGEIVVNDKTHSLVTTGARRTGCFACGFGIQIKGDRRWQSMMDNGYENLVDYILRGGEFGETGMWIPKGGLGMAFVYEWINVHGGYDINIPDKEHYLSKLPERAKEMLTLDLKGKE